MALTPGLRANRLIMVEKSDTAERVGSGDVPVLATPRLLALAEGLTCEAIGGELTHEQTSVGVRVELQHLAASGLGAHVEISAELVEVEGRRLVFSFTAAHRDGSVVATGVIERVVVDREKFLSRTIR
ncbi:thioesterase family protein [Herbidospora sp. RD11066]